MLKKSLIGVTFTCVLAGILVYASSLIIKNEQWQLFGELVSRVDTQEKVIALTFDDGPKPGRTEEVLATLADEKVPATFFLNGDKIIEHPQQVQQIMAAGHQIGNHSYSHRRLVFVPYSEIAKEIENTTVALRRLGYSGVMRFRPPYGKSFLTLPWYLSEHDITTVTWDVAPEHFKHGEDTENKIFRRTIEQTRPGSIVLLHVMYGDGATLRALPRIIKALKVEGYRFVTVEELLSLRRP